MNEIASRYASSLYSLALEKNEVVSWQQEIKEIDSLLNDNLEFINILSSAFISLKNKEELIDKTLVGVRDEIKNLVKVLCKNHRENQIFNVFQSFNSMCNQYREVKEGLVYSTYKLDEVTLKKISDSISNVEKSKVELYNKIDPTMIGGIKVVINGHIYDGSIKSYLFKMKQDLLK